MNRKPPANIARQLRQEAFFGCCKCGVAVYDYHHIIEYSVVQHFRAEDMMILCPTCHREITAFPKEQQYKIKNRPFNRGRYPKGQLYYFNNQLTIKFMDNYFINTPILLYIDDTPLIGLQKSDDGQVLINALLFNQQNELLVKLDGNEWTSYKDEIWDIVHRANYLKISLKIRDILLEIDLTKDPIIIRGSFWKNGCKVTFDEKFMLMSSINSKTWTKGSTFNSDVGVYINSKKDGVYLGCSLNYIEEKLR